MDEEDLVAFILNGLDDEYEPAISRLVTRVEPVTVAEFYSILLNYENRQNLLHDAFANAANHGRGGPPNRGDAGRGRGAPAPAIAATTRSRGRSRSRSTMPASSTTAIWQSSLSTVGGICRCIVPEILPVLIVQQNRVQFCDGNKFYSCHQSRDSRFIFII
jgi:hypothetical protein